MTKNPKQDGRAETKADKLAEAVSDYLRECDNPVPDYLHRRNLREHLRVMLVTYENGIKP